MNNKLFVGNLPYSTTGAQLRDWFAQAGTVETADVIMERESGRSKGFGFVTMSSDEEAQTAISMFNGKEQDGRALVVNVARPKEDRPPRRDFGGYRNNGGGYGR
jgi:RNA recognition motif-containing protein